MFRTKRTIIWALFFAAASLDLSNAARAQSGDASFPTPVFTNEVTGRIAPRDVGDSRRTIHFYTFRGTEGDLTVTFDSTDLSGDVDVYTATTLRPLLKITLLGDAAHVTKGFYIRSEERLLLRVEARAVGDTDGTYRITFGGSFEPAPPELANETPPPTPTVKESDARDKGVRRTTATGARIEEPATESPKEEAKDEVKPEPTPTPAAETPAPRSTTAKRGAGARTNPRRIRAATEAKTDTNNETPTSETPAPKPAPRRGTRGTRRGAGSASARTESGAQPSANSSTPPATSEPEPAQHLRILTKDGGLIDRDMNSVRRVTVEGGQLVVVTTDGKTIREPLSNVLKMSIEP
jgi:hypothetical protein